MKGSATVAHILHTRFWLREKRRAM